MEIERAQNLCRGCTGEACKQPARGMIPVVHASDGRFYAAYSVCRHERNRREREKIARLFAYARIPRAYAGDTLADYTVTDGNRKAV